MGLPPQTPFLRVMYGWRSLRCAVCIDFVSVLFGIFIYLYNPYNSSLFIILPNRIPPLKQSNSDNLEKKRDAFFVIEHISVACTEESEVLSVNSAKQSKYEIPRFARNDRKRDCFVAELILKRSRRAGPRQSHWG